MTAALSADCQQAVLADIEARKKQNLKSAKKNFAVAVAGAAGCLALGLLLPPLGLLFLPSVPALAAGFVGLVGFNKLMQNWGREKTLKGIADEVKQESFTDKLKARSAGIAKNFLRARNTFDVLFFGTCLALFVTVLTPLEAPALAIVAGFAAAAVASSVYNRACGAHWAAEAVVTGVEKLTAPPKTAAAKAIKAAPPPVELPAAPQPAAAQPAFAQAVTPEKTQAVTPETTPAVTSEKTPETPKTDKPKI